jgi:hypothetical protein
VIQPYPPPPPPPPSNPYWPQIDPPNTGPQNFTHVLNFQSLNANIAPLSTNNEGSCHPDNLTSLATAATVPKVVYYPATSGKYYAAFNENINHTLNGFWTAADNWRVVWATSTDGRTWNIYPHILFRSTDEVGHCDGGLSNADMLVDNGYFYLFVLEVGTSNIYLFRSQIDQNSTYGFDVTPSSWYVACNPLSNGNYTWKQVTLTGDPDRLDLSPTGLNAYVLMTGKYSRNFVVSRVYQSSNANSPSLYVGIASTGQKYPGHPQSGSQLQVWSTSDLSKPFAFAGNVINPIGLQGGEYGWNLAMTRFGSGYTSEQKVIASNLDLWTTSQEGPPGCQPGANCAGVMNSRVNVKISGDIFGIGVTSIAPSGGSGAVPITITGFNFVSGATVTVGVFSATSVVWQGATQITATTPSLLPGTVADVVVRNPDGTTDTLPAAFVADFSDVPPSAPYYSAVAALARNAITGGCGSGNYCFGSAVTRENMAVFLEKAIRGASFVPPNCQHMYPSAPGYNKFTDVSDGSLTCPFIAQLVADGITGGCTSTTFCPTSATSRAQMAIFVIAALWGNSLVVPTASCPFPFVDVTCPSVTANYVLEATSTESIMVHCQTGSTYFCPSDPVTRADMATFIVNGFNLYSF